MRPRFVGRVGLADVVTLAHAAVGVLAIFLAFEDLELAARLVLLAAILDGVDGIVARLRGGTPIGPHIDSLADVASFGVAPAVIVYVAVIEQWALTPTSPGLTAGMVTGVLILFVAVVILRLALYTVYDTDSAYTEGVQSTLAATVIGAAVLARVTDPIVLLGLTAAFVVLMVCPIRYPDLLARDAAIMGVVHAGAVIAPTAFGRALPWALLILGVAYLVAAPWLYWRNEWLLARLKGNA